MPELTCIVCPQGCRLDVKGTADHLIISGHNCPRGEEYARNEVISPKRVITSVVKVSGTKRFLPVKTASPVPKEKIFSVMEEIKRVKARLPVETEQIIVTNLAETGVVLIATKSMKA